jgi:hypothetical protein
MSNEFVLFVDVLTTEYRTLRENLSLIMCPLCVVLIRGLTVSIGL